MDQASFGAGAWTWIFHSTTVTTLLLEICSRAYHSANRGDCSVGSLLLAAYYILSPY